MQHVPTTLYCCCATVLLLYCCTADVLWDARPSPTCPVCCLARKICQRLQCKINMYCCPPIGRSGTATTAPTAPQLLALPQLAITRELLCWEWHQKHSWASTRSLGVGEGNVNQFDNKYNMLYLAVDGEASTGNKPVSKKCTNIGTSYHAHGSDNFQQPDRPTDYGSPNGQASLSGCTNGLESQAGQSG